MTPVPRLNLNEAGPASFNDNGPTVVLSISMVEFKDNILRRHADIAVLRNEETHHLLWSRPGQETGAIRTGRPYGQPPRTVPYG